MSGKTNITRRRFMRSIASVAAATAAGGHARVWATGSDDYSGKLLVTLQLQGGFDATQFCDPKMNTPGEPKINNWADRLETGTAGRLKYAPIADNQRFFNSFRQHMMVINGVDCQTNSHDTGQLFNWTGSNREGSPSIAALHAAANAPEQPLAYSVFNGFSRTSGLIGYNRFNDLNALRPLADPTRYDDGGFVRPELEMMTAQNLAADSIQQILSSPGLTPRQFNSSLQLLSARQDREKLARLVDFLPRQEDVPEPVEEQIGDFNFWSDLRMQMQGALVVFKSGMGAAAEISLGGFDTHNDHDAPSDRLLTEVSDAVHYFWDEAARMGLSDRITLLIGSDFSRTNFYNDGNGKDHWPIGSYIVMEDNPAWGNRTVGATDELHFAKTLDPGTLKESTSFNAVTLTPAHIHKSLHEYLGIEVFAQSVGFDLDQIQSLPIFNPSRFT